MANMNGFDASTVKPSEALEPIPAGKYPVAIVESEEKPTAAGTGSYLQFVFQVLDGPHRGRKLWARMNVKNPSAQAVEIARAELSALCRAVSILRPRDSSELHNRPLTVKVTVKRGDDGEFRNEIKGYMPLERAAGAPGAAPARPYAAPAAPAATPAPAASSAPAANPADPPWKRAAPPAAPAPAAQEPAAPPA